MAFGIATYIQGLGPEPWNRADAAIRDGYLRLQADPRSEDRLVIVDIDELSLQKIGSWPWSRGLLADLAESILVEGGASAIALDMVLPNGADLEGDARLATLATHAPLTLSHVMDAVPRKDPIRVGTLAVPVTDLNPDGALQANGYLANHSGLANARCVGNIGYLPDNDGVLRHSPAKIKFDNLTLLPLSVAVLRCANVEVPLPLPNEKGQWRIPYLHSINAYTVVPAIQVILGTADPEIFRGRYVLIGSTALGLNDRVATPLHELMPGILVHAQAISGLLDIIEGRARAPWSGATCTLAWTVVTVVLSVIAIGHLNAWRGTLILLSFAFLWLIFSWVGVAKQAEFSITAPLTAYFVALSTSVPFEWWQTQRKTRHLIDTFSLYVAKPVVDQIVNLRLQHSLTPKQSDITVLIVDMEGYTRTTAALTLSDAAKLTKEFLTCVTNAVLAAGGTLDKYTGDGLVAFWGAPVPSHDHADLAVAAGLNILADVSKWNQVRIRKGEAALRVRVGIESGPALVGDLGTYFRNSYTAVGDCINIAAKLESAARNLPCDVVLGPQTQVRLTRSPTRSLGLFQLNGSQSEIEIFTPV